MLNKSVLHKLESIRNLPTMPIIVSEVLSAVDNPKSSAASLAKIIEKDQALTARVLRIANSPFYGYTRKISTIDLAIVIMGFNTLKEIVLSIVIQRFFSKVNTNVFNLKDFWQYGLFSGSAARLLSRKLGYKLAGEAFVAGLMHDIGVLIIAEYFTTKFKEIKQYIATHKVNLLDAEQAVLGCTHSEIGAWIADKWNLPDKMVKAIQNHHINFSYFSKNAGAGMDDDILSEIDQPLTAMVSLAEWFAQILGFKNWIDEPTTPEYYLSSEVFGDFSINDIMDSESAMFALRTELLDEFAKANIFNELNL
ncbi:MAG: HDOD domain-containing protein [Candidatus Kapabacteria bacterium]|nr:HDOD domain-containing protein [Ignavibacteriota bacterium]MCW5883501.1 HDOD domain-containing protein [Candidatus Kapabacteria bacterium]